MVSMTCSPTVNTGLSEVIGSWNTMAMPGPRIRCMRASESSVSTSPPKRTSPDATRAGGCGSRPVMVSAVTLLPLPDSPTMPRISPSSNENERSSTAVIAPREVANAVVRLVTESRDIRLRARAERQLEKQLEKEVEKEVEEDSEKQSSPSPCGRGLGGGGRAGS